MKNTQEKTDWGSVITPADLVVTYENLTMKEIISAHWTIKNIERTLLNTQREIDRSESSEREEKLEDAIRKIHNLLLGHTLQA